MVAASEMTDLTGLSHEDITPVCTDIGKQVQVVFLISYQHERLVQVVFKQGERVSGTRFPDKIAVADELPGSSE